MERSQFFNDPTTKELYGLVSQNKALENPLSSMVEEIKQNTNSLNAFLNTNKNIEEIATSIPILNPSSAILDMKDIMSPVNKNLVSGVNMLKSHTDGLIFGQHPSTPLINSFAGGFATAQNAISFYQDIDPRQDVCSRVEDFFGSVLGTGKEILDGLLAPIKYMGNLIQQGIGAALGFIGELTQEVLGFVGRIMQTVANEVGSFLKSLTDMANYSLSSLLSAGSNDPCMAKLINNVMSPPALGLLGKVKI